MENGGQRVTINGKHIFIGKGQKLNTNKYMNEKIRGEVSKKKGGGSIKGYPKFETNEQHRKRLIDNQEKQKKYEKERDEKLEKLGNDDGFSKIYNDYNKKINDLRNKTIYDETNDRYIVLSKDDIFTDENKKYTTSSDIKNLTPQEESAITNYTSQYGNGSYSTVNRYLYNGNTSSFSNDNVTKESIDNLSSAMQKNKIGGSYQLYRGVEPEYLNNSKAEAAVKKINKAVDKGGIRNPDKYIDDLYSMVGEKIENKGFMSTSTYLDPNYVSRGVTYVINTKPSDRAIDVQSLSKYGGKQDTAFAAFSKGGIQKESEVLYDRNTDLIVRDIAITDKGVFFLCDTEQKRR